MLRITELKLPLNHSSIDLQTTILYRLKIDLNEFIKCHIFRQGHDARKRDTIVMVYTVDVEIHNEAEILVRFANDTNISRTPDTEYHLITPSTAFPKIHPIIIGSGPCGLLATLILAQMGFKPIMLERGKSVRERTKDTFALWRKREFNSESNVQFGEGGAGTFSDGKLYTQIKDPNYYGRKVLQEFVKAGAPEEILYLSKPHIGTFRLVTMVEKIRATIESLGGEIRFESRVDELLIEDVQTTISSAIGGMKISTTVEGRERFPIRIRYAREYRDNPEDSGDENLHRAPFSLIVITRRVAPAMKRQFRKRSAAET